MPCGEMFVTSSGEVLMLSVCDFMERHLDDVFDETEFAL
jgi:hypothetical protein